MIKENYYVEQIDSKETYSWLLNKHYAHRLPMAVEYSFGLFENKLLQGVCVFGPTAPPVPKTIFGENYNKYKVRELTRLVINDNLKKNVLSFFVSQCLKLIKETMCIVSFSDMSMNHHGYIYQATNFYYTGEGGQPFNFIDKNGDEIHSLTINDGAERENINQSEYLKKHNIKKEKAKPKYRYVFFLGNKTEKKQMNEDIILKILPYPKGDNKRYDASYNPDIQMRLF